MMKKAIHFHNQFQEYLDKISQNMELSIEEVQRWVGSDFEESYLKIMHNEKILLLENFEKLRNEFFSKQTLFSLSKEI
jgi:hypothetical protein